MVKKASLRCRTVEWVVEEGLREKRIGIWNYWAYGDNSCTDGSQVLGQVRRAVWLLDG